ncbi:MAG: aminomethyl-transferring glycine dehydrogenase subunit GcvPB [Candidatus Methanomethylicota archaeon]|uniref:Probable glycine dehydrogenase (decarboxylating) subunit 2 n=1 Tax=Thermoproteota archaeon TaxID=2056631 RepID=A0A497EPT9_9CREN|nr:MAG: aminomethyl-transferring glycine dehydrogenase subunit GcvPB [Candidatus Verstraetearchaeota archaeon]
MRDYAQAKWDEPLIFEITKAPRKTFSVPLPCDDVIREVGSLEELVPKNMLRHELSIPDLSEVEVIRHFTKLTQMNYGVDLGPYPLGSCTMKYNPKVNEELANLDEVLWIHPYQPEEQVQGALELMYKLEQLLASLTGMHKVTLQPAAGAHGELVGCLIMKAHFKRLGENQRDEILIPDSAHGTNPASAAMCGFRVIEIPSNEEGCVDLEALKAVLSKHTAGLMLTNPNTLGIFEKDVLEIAKMVHEVGGLLYYDGANLQGILGKVRPGDMGFDIVHLNLHKTFSTPHGGGGPGSGPIGVTRELEDYLPVPTIEFDGRKYWLNYDKPYSIGKVKGFYGNFSVMVKAYAYILSMGLRGLIESCEISVLNTNYFMKKAKELKGMSIPYGEKPRKHEVVLSAEKLSRETGVTAMDVAKALIDKGLHPPTIYFPLIVKEALMIEFTDTESRENIDRYFEALKEIVEEAYSNPSLVKERPKKSAVFRLDETKASHPKTMCLSYRMYRKKKSP